MPNIDHTDVLVCGAGPVGMLTALFLAKNGVKTQIIDQEARTTGHSYSCALHPRTLEILDDLGLAEELAARGRRIHTVAFYEGKERRAEVKLSALPGKYPYALVIEQSALETLLEKRLQDENIKVKWNHRLANLEIADDGAGASIEELCMSGKGYGVPEFDVEVKKTLQTWAKFVVGTDGAKSTVRGKIGILMERTAAPQHFEVYEMAARGLWSGEARVVLDSAYASVLWPLSETRGRWSFQVRAEAEAGDFPGKERDRVIIVEEPDEQDRAHRMQRFIKERAPWFEIPVQEVVWTTDVQFEPRLARHFGRKCCWLAGDAAHQTGPVGMQSMNIGCLEAADLARILSQILQDGSSPDLLKTYDRSHWSDWNQLLNVKVNSTQISAASEWVRRNIDRILSSIPASGPDLAALVKQMGVNIP
jgi:2-polyprenyl-6-methoxyphenol hydroxylase-like FAD-dependent oxidoreductase